MVRASHRGMKGARGRNGGLIGALAVVAMVCGALTAPGARPEVAHASEPAAPQGLEAAVERDLGITLEQYEQQAQAAVVAAEVAALASVEGIPAEPRLDGDTPVVVVEKSTDAAAIDALAASVPAVDVEALDVLVEAGSTPFETDVVFRPAVDAFGGDPVIFGGGSLRCSIGAAGTDSSRAPVLLTAGHCRVSSTTDVYRHLAVASPGFQLRGSQTSIGTAVPGSFVAGGGVDAGLIRDTSVTVTGVDEVETYSGGQGPSRATSIVVRDVVEPVVGAPVCKSGATSGWTCGRILAVNESVTVSGDGASYLVDGVITDACILLGDSGGPAMVGDALLGINSATAFGGPGTDTSSPARSCDTTSSDNRLSVLFAFRSSLTGMSTVASTYGSSWEPTVRVETPVVTEPAPGATFDATSTLVLRGTLASPTPRTWIDVRWGAAGKTTTVVAADGTWSIAVPGSALSGGAQSLEVTARWGQRSISSPVLLLGSTSTGWNRVAVERVQGDSRYDTAVELTRRAFPTGGVGPVFLVVGTNYPDALAASPVAAELGGAVLLTAKDALPTVVRDELLRLGPTEIIIVGGPLAISAKTEDEVRALGLPVRRLQGDSRYDTAALLTELAFPGGATTAYVATGTNFPDGLAAGAAGAAIGAPVLLAPGTQGVLPAATSTALRDLEVGEIYALGAAPVMSPALVSSLDAIAPTTRLGGDTRYDTAGLIADTAHPAGSVADRIYLATGLNFPDALAVGSLAGPRGDALLLVQPQCVPVSVLARMAALQPSEVVVLGGPIALSAPVDRLARC